MVRVMGVIAIVAGTVIVGFDPKRFDSVILTLPRGHGLHLHDVVGAALITLGVVVLWWSPRSGRPTRET
jgi:uncharacterized protein YjeT (DUF2065 family)